MVCRYDQIRPARAGALAALENTAYAVDWRWGACSSRTAAVQMRPEEKAFLHLPRSRLFGNRFGMFQGQESGSTPPVLTSAIVAEHGNRGELAIKMMAPVEPPKRPSGTGHRRQACHRDTVEAPGSLPQAHHGVASLATNAIRHHRSAFSPQRCPSLAGPMAKHHPSPLLACFASREAKGGKDGKRSPNKPTVHGNGRNQRRAQEVQERIHNEGTRDDRLQTAFNRFVTKFSERRGDRAGDNFQT